MESHFEPATIEAAVIFGDDVHLFGDGRASDENGIQTGAAIKLRQIHNSAISYSGECRVLAPMHAIISSVAQLSFLETIGIRNICQEFIRSWKNSPQNEGNSFPGNVLICGSSPAKTPIIYQVGEEYMEITQSSDIVVVGSGKNVFAKYLDLRIVDALTCTCLKTNCCGGFISYTKVSFNSISRVSHKRLGHFFSYFANNFSRLGWLFQNNEILCVSSNLKYSLALESMLKNSIESELSISVYIQVIAIRVDLNLIFRIISCPRDCLLDLQQLNLQNFKFEKPGEDNLKAFSSFFAKASKRIKKSTHSMLNVIDGDDEFLRLF